MPGRALLLVTLLCGLGTGALSAQEPDTTRAALPRDQERDQERPVADTTPPAPDTLPEPAPYVAPRFAVGLTFGTAGLGTLQSQPVLAERLDLSGTPRDSVMLTRSVEAERGLMVGATALLSLSPAWAVRAGIGVGRTTLRTAYDGEDDDDLYVATAERLGAMEEVDATLLAVEAALRVRLPSGRRVQPYLEVGAFGLRWDADEDRAGIRVGGVQRIGAQAAVGAVVPLTRRLSATVQATDRVFRTPVDPAPAGTPDAAGSSLALTLQAPGAYPYADESYTLTNVVQLDLGIRITGGAAAGPPPGPAGSPASTSPTGH